MKVLVLSHTRCGSTTLCKWLSKELNYSLDETPYDLDTFASIFELNNVIRKIVVEEYYPNYDVINKFDKVIYLTRDNSFDAAVSFLTANKTNVWHDDYSVSPDWIKENENNLIRCANNYEIMKSKLKNYIGFHSTYEKIFIKKDILPILEYLKIETPNHLYFLEINKKYRKDKNSVFQSVQSKII